VSRSFISPEPWPFPAFVIVVSVLPQLPLLPELPGHGPVPAVGPDEQVVVVVFAASAFVANGAIATAIATLATAIVNAIFVFIIPGLYKVR
jgi:hypothetical protein